MTTITLFPLKGIDIDGVGRIDLGQSRADVEAKIGSPDNDYSDEERSVYSAYECNIDFDDADSVSFIEFYSGPFPERIQLRIYGIDPFQIGAENLVALLKEKNDGLVEGGEDDFAYAFLTISVGIWKDAREKDVLEWAEQKRRTENMRSIGNGSKKSWQNPGTSGPSGSESRATTPSRKNYEAALAF